MESLLARESTAPPRPLGASPREYSLLLSHSQRVEAWGWQLRAGAADADAADAADSTAATAATAAASMMFAVGGGRPAATASAASPHSAADAAAAPPKSAADAAAASSPAITAGAAISRDSAIAAARIGSERSASSFPA
ncbi:MAG: hypothetical protein VX113_09895, partial [Pseudomonadota bacterium]|nr:hypothetical protein [Pseudomonadota bacterium]